MPRPFPSASTAAAAAAAAEREKRRQQHKQSVVCCMIFVHRGICVLSWPTNSRLRLHDVRTPPSAFLFSTFWHLHITMRAHI